MINKIKGIFSDTQKESSNPNNDEQQKIVNMVQDDFQVFKASRQRMDDIWRQEYRFYEGDHWSHLRSDDVTRKSPNAVDNIVFSQVESIVAKLAGWMPQPDFQPQEPGDEDKAVQLNDFIPYELRQINFKQKYIRALRRMVINGTLLFKVIHDPLVEGGRGLNRWQGRNDIIPMDLTTFYPDPRLRDFIDMQEGSAHIVRTNQTLEYFKERFGKRGEMVESMSEDVNIYEGESETSADTDKTAELIEYWYRGTPKMMSKKDKELFREQAEDRLMNGLDPSEDLAKVEGKMDGVHCIYIANGVFLEHKSYIYDHGQYPFVARTLFPDEAGVWGKGFMRDMMKPQVLLNMYAELTISTIARQGASNIIYEESAISKIGVWKEQKGKPGALLPLTEGGMNKVKETQGVNVPNTVFHMFEYYKEMLQKIPGQYDSSVGQANPNVTSGEQAKALIAAASTRLNVVSETVEEALEEVFAQYIELIAQFYTTERVARVTGKTVGISRDSLVSNVPSEFEVPGETIIDEETGEELPNTIGVVEEYMPEFDIHVSIGVEKPNDRDYWVQLAMNLLTVVDPLTGLPMVDVDAVRYTIQHGRMEPMDVIADRIKASMEQAQQQQVEQQMQMQQLQQQQMQGVPEIPLEENF